MNVFVLNTGRCGSTTFIKACSHIRNFSCAHESHAMFAGDARLDYPQQHIEADNRLSWFLGRLDAQYGDDAMYVHLVRDAEKVALSFSKRYSKGIISSYQRGILLGLAPDTDPLVVCRDYVHTVNSNIRSFLSNKTNTFEFRLERASEDFPVFWKKIGAIGNLEEAIAEFNIPYNATKIDPADDPLESSMARRVFGKVRRVGRKLPQFIVDA